jgi:hypothetical protein
VSAVWAGERVGPRWADGMFDLSVVTDRGNTVYALTVDTGGVLRATSKTPADEPATRTRTGGVRGAEPVARWKIRWATGFARPAAQLPAMVRLALVWCIPSIWSFTSP